MSRSKSREFAVLVFFILCLTMVGNTIAVQKQDKQKPAVNVKQDSPPVESTISDGAIKMFLDKIDVLGRLEKPQAVFIVPGTNPEIDDIRIDRSFFNEIFRTVEKSGRQGSSALSESQQRRKDFIPW